MLQKNIFWGVTLGRRSYGCLNENTIQKEELCYEKTILRYKENTINMKKDIYATLYRSMSTYEMFPIILP